MYNDEPLTRDILGNLLQDSPSTVEDNPQVDDEELSMPIRIIGWIIAIVIMGLIIGLFAFLFISVFDGFSIFTIIVIIGLIGCIPGLFLRGKL